MATTPRLSPTARGLITLYGSTLLAGMWSMIVPALPVLARSFDISPGVAAQPRLRASAGAVSATASDRPHETLEK